MTDKNIISWLEHAFNYDICYTYITFLRVGYGIDTLSPHDFAIKQMTTKNNVIKNFEPWYPKWIPDNNIHDLQLAIHRYLEKTLCEDIITRKKQLTNLSSQ